MSRVENGKFNGIAGIEGLNLIRKYDLNIPVFFYIGDLKKAHQKFIENKVDIKNIKIGNQTI